MRPGKLSDIDPPSESGNIRPEIFVNSDAIDDITPIFNVKNSTDEDQKEYEELMRIAELEYAFEIELKKQGIFTPFKLS